MNCSDMSFEISRCTEGFSTMMTFEIPFTFIRVIVYLTDSKRKKNVVNRNYYSMKYSMYLHIHMGIIFERFKNHTSNSLQNFLCRILYRLIDFRQYIFCKKSFYWIVTKNFVRIWKTKLKIAKKCLNLGGCWRTYFWLI